MMLTSPSVAVSLRRPRIINFDSEGQATLAAFAAHATHVNDRRLVAWMHLQLIAEDVENLRICLSVGGRAFNDERTCQLVELQNLNNRFLSFRNNLSEVMNGAAA